MNLRRLLIQLTAKDDASKVLQSFSQRAKKMGDNFVRVGKTMTRRFTAPIMAGAGLAIKAFADFDDKLNQSTAIMGDVSSAMRKDMSDAARTVARTTTFAADEAAESFFFLASAGMDAEASISALPAVAQFAQAGMFDMALATDLATDAQSALGLASKDANENLDNLTRITDVLVGANTLANASVEQFAESLTTRAGAALRLVGKDVEEGVAVLAAWADQGVKGAEAGNRLDIVLRDLQNASIRNREEFQKLGIEVFDAEGNIRNLADIVGDMEESFDGMSDEQLRTSLTTLGFTDRSIAATASLLGMSDQIRTYEKDLRNMGGVTEEVANKQLESFTNQWSLLKSEVLDVAISIGERLSPHLMTLRDMIKRLVEWFRELNPGAQNFILVLLGILAAVGPLLIGLGIMIKTVGIIAGAFALLTGPVLIVIGIIAALAALAFVVMKNWDAIKSWFIKMWDTLTEKFGRAMNWIKNKVDWLRNNFWEAIGMIIGFFATLPIRIPLLVAKAIMWVVRFVKNINWSGVFSSIWSAMKRVWDNIKDGASTAWKFIKNIKWGQVLTSIGKGIGNAIVGLIEGAIRGATKGIPGLGRLANISLPRFAEGVRDFRGGAAIVGEQGPELVTLPRGSNVHTAEDTAAMTQGGTTLNVDLDVNVGIYAGSETEKHKVGATIWNSIIDVARAQGVELSGKVKLR